MPDTALMFSGGVDSTMAAIRLAERFDRVHLLTYANGHGTAKLGRAGQRVEELRARYGGERFPHLQASTRDVMVEIVTRDLVATYKRYGSGFVWCLGCKLAMHARSTVYCLEQGISEMCDGSSSSTQEMVEQMPVSLAGIRRFYATYGIRFSTPVYDEAREDEQAELRRRGFRMGLQIRGRNVGIQPSCYAGLIYYAPFLLFHQPPRHDEDAVARFLDERGERAHRWVRRWFEDQGRAVPRLSEEAP